jgi:hypothetical protein
LSIKRLNIPRHNCSILTFSLFSNTLGLVAKKILTISQAETAKRRAALFVDNVLDDPDRADDIEDESLEEWAQETGRTIRNPNKKKGTMPKTVTAIPTKADLQDTLDKVTDMLAEALDPVLTREEVIQKLQDMDAFLSDDEDDEDDENDADDEDSDDDSDA